MNNSLNLEKLLEILVARLSRQKEIMTDIKQYLNQLKPFISDSIETPSKNYNHQQWTHALDSIDRDAHITTTI